MDSILQLCETLGSKYPEHFKTFLNNCQETFADTFHANDYLFAAVYFLTLECGFFPVNLGDELAVHSDSFDIRKMRLVKSYSNEHMKPMKSDVSAYWVYGIPLKLGNFRTICELQGVPSAENSLYLIINFLSRQLGVIKSLCLNTENYTERLDPSSKEPFRLKNLRELSVVIKDRVSNSIKDCVMLNEGPGCYPNLLRLPEEIQKKIIYNLLGNCSDVLCLSSSCSYFYHVISNDYKLWEIICMIEFDGKMLNEALHDILQVSDSNETNLFRKVFLKLKKQTIRRGCRYLRPYDLFN